MSVEARRGCGYRKVGGLYLVCSGSGLPCDRLPFVLDVCPTCHAGIKQARGWTWIEVAALTGGVHKNCKDTFPCPFCMATSEMGSAGLLWVGTQFYKTPQDFIKEADKLGLSRRISAIPRNFEVGKTWVLLAHPKGKRVNNCQTEACNHIATVHTEKGCAVEGCQCRTPNFYQPAIFRIFRPARIEKIITETQSRDAELMQDLAKRNITPVVVPDNDADHQGNTEEE